MTRASRLLEQRRDVGVLLVGGDDDQPRLNGFEQGRGLAYLFFPDVVPAVSDDCAGTGAGQSSRGSRRGLSERQDGPEALLSRLSDPTLCQRSGEVVERRFRFRMLLTGEINSVLRQEESRLDRHLDPFPGQALRG